MVSQICGYSKNHGIIDFKWVSCMVCGFYFILFIYFFQQECWSGLPFPPPGDLSDPGIKPESPASPALAGGFFTTELPGNPYVNYILKKLL